MDTKFKKGLVPWNKDIPVSNENKKRHSEFMKNYYKTHKHPMFRRKQSEESYKKLNWQDNCFIFI